MRSSRKMEKLWAQYKNEEEEVHGMDNVTTEEIKDMLLRALDDIDRMESDKEEFEKMRQAESEAMEREVASYRALVAEKDVLIAETDARTDALEKKLSKSKK